MTCSGLVGLTVLLGLGRACLAGAQDGSPDNIVESAFDDAANPYSVIPKRNVFGLNPPPPPPEAEKAAPPNLPKIRLSGFMRKGDPWKVLLVVEADSPDPHGHPVTSYLTLGEGDKQTVRSGSNGSVVELVKAYADQEKVDIINSGTPMTLTLKENGIASPAPSRESRAKAAEVDRAIFARTRLRYGLDSPAPSEPPPAQPTPETGNPEGGVRAPVAVPLHLAAPALTGDPQAIDGGASNNVNSVIVVGGSKETPPSRP